MPGSERPRFDIPLTRTIRVPDPYRVERWERIPELGPRILFFSGGTALKRTSRRLKRYTHNSAHLITPFDSGGSSAELRQRFAMPSIGDLRNRLVALADESIQGNPEIYELFSHRLSAEGSTAELRAGLDRLVEGTDPLVASLPGSFGRIVRTHLRSFRNHLSDSDTGFRGPFDLRGASIGNLLLTAGYLDNERDLDSAIFLLAKLLHVNGQVQLVSDVNLQLLATLEDGSEVEGQHLLGRSGGTLGRRIESVRLVSSGESSSEASAPLTEKSRRAIAAAELICYPMGSLFSSVIAPLLADGIPEALESSGAPKIFVPNTGVDPEQYGHSPSDAVDRLLNALGRSLEDPGGVLDLVLLDSSDSSYELPPDRDRIRNSRLELIELPLVDGGSEPRITAERLVEVLLSLA